MEEEKIKLVLQYFNGNRESIIKALRQTNYSLTETLILLIQTPDTVCIPKQKELSEEQLFFKRTRQQLENLDKSILDGFTSQDQRGSSGPSDLQDRHEEMVQQSNCSQECQIPSLELEVQRLETVCPLPFVYSSGSL